MLESLRRNIKSATNLVAGAGRELSLLGGVAAVFSVVNYLDGDFSFDFRQFARAIVDGYGWLINWAFQVLDPIAVLIVDKIGLVIPFDIQLSPDWLGMWTPMALYFFSAAAATRKAYGTWGHFRWDMIFGILISLVVSPIVTADGISERTFLSVTIVAAGFILFSLLDISYHRFFEGAIAKTRFANQKALFLAYPFLDFLIFCFVMIAATRFERFQIPYSQSTLVLSMVFLMACRNISAAMVGATTDRPKDMVWFEFLQSLGTFLHGRRVVIVLVFAVSLILGFTDW